MTLVWSVSYLVEWLVVIVEAVLLLGLLRQVGSLQEQLSRHSFDPENSVPRLEDDGPPIGAVIPFFSSLSINGFGRMESNSVVAHSSALLVFLSPLCDSCQQIVGPLNLLAREEYQDLYPVIIMLGDESACRAFNELFAIDFPLIVDADRSITRSFNVHRSPLGLVYRRGGKLTKKGKVLSNEDISILVADSLPPRAEPNM